MTQPFRILVVEDQYLVALDCQRHLQSAGFVCIGPAASAEEAVELAQKERPDLILMDVRLATRMTGVEAAIDIYLRFGIRSIFASGHADAAMHEQARPANPVGWLNKPYTPEDLIRTIGAGCDIGTSESGQREDGILSLDPTPALA